MCALFIPSTRTSLCVCGFGCFFCFFLALSKLDLSVITARLRVVHSRIIGSQCTPEVGHYKSTYSVAAFCKERTKCNKKNNAGCHVSAVYVNFDANSQGLRAQTSKKKTPISKLIGFLTSNGVKGDVCITWWINIFFLKME